MSKDYELITAQHFRMLYSGRYDLTDAAASRKNSGLKTASPGTADRYMALREAPMAKTPDTQCRGFFGIGSLAVCDFHMGGRAETAQHVAPARTPAGRAAGPGTLAGRVFPGHKGYAPPAIVSRERRRLQRSG